jgi:hypothetical protein
LFFLSNKLSALNNLNPNCQRTYFIAPALFLKCKAEEQKKFIFFALLLTGIFRLGGG